MNSQTMRLMQALEFFSARTRGSQLPKGVEEAIAALQSTLGHPAPGNDTPGTREALKVAPGTDGTGENFRKAAIGVDGPSPGQKEAHGVSAEIAKAAAQIASRGGASTPTET
jgi:hypothetical protein